MVDRTLLSRAARLLENEAEALFESCHGATHAWACQGMCDGVDARGKCKAQRTYEEMVRTVEQLREAARGS